MHTHVHNATGSHRSRRRSYFDVVRRSWPSDPRHRYQLWLEASAVGGKSRGYVTAHPIYSDTGTHCRFAIRMDLPGWYRNVGEAARDAYYLAHRFAAGKLSRPIFFRSKFVKAYKVQARARFRIDRHAWEPDVTVHNVSSTGLGAFQHLGGQTSPFLDTTFGSEQVAVEYGLAYGERLVLRVIGGLRV